MAALAWLVFVMLRGKMGTAAQAIRDTKRRRVQWAFASCPPSA